MQLQRQEKGFFLGERLAREHKEKSTRKEETPIWPRSRYISISQGEEFPEIFNNPCNARGPWRGVDLYALPIIRFSSTFFSHALTVSLIRLFVASAAFIEEIQGFTRAARRVRVESLAPKPRHRRGRVDRSLRDPADSAFDLLYIHIQ